MFSFIKKLLGIGPGIDYKEIISRGATIIDVRSKEEFQGGHIKSSINIPVQDLENNLSKIKKDKPVIACCATGARSASAKFILKTNGYTEVYNAGGWMSLQRKIN